MSDAKKRDDSDDLMAQLGSLPALGSGEEALGTRHQREARAAYVQAFEGEPLHVRLFGNAGFRRAAVPLALLGVVVVYMHWAATAARKLMQ